MSTLTDFFLVGRCRVCGREPIPPGACTGCGEQEHGWWCRTCRQWLCTPLCKTCGGLDCPKAIDLGQVPRGATIGFTLNFHNRTGRHLELGLRSAAPWLAFEQPVLALAPDLAQASGGQASFAAEAAGELTATIEVEGPLPHRIRLRARVVNCGLTGGIL